MTTLAQPPATTPVPSVLETALRARDAGISVIAIREDGSKAPVGAWREQMREIPSDEQVRRAFARSTGLAFVCGQVSGGLECLDFDETDAFDAFVELCRASGHGDLVERVMTGYHERSPRGVHLLYRCSSPRSTKLARRREEEKVKAIIETKGEGGYVIVAPSHGGVHPEGVYELVRGSIETIVTLTDDEREALHAVARALNEDVQPAHVEPELGPAPDRGERPGDEWARMTSWAEILEPHGWVRLWTRGPITYWRRPGKSVGVSATTNYADTDLLYVFSTSTDFEANRGYGKFGAYAILAHGGDFRAAARELRARGYGTSRPAPVEVDISAILAPRAEAPAQDDTFPAHLYDVPGLVGELWRYIVESATMPQPVLALGAAICAVGTLAGRRVQSETGLLTNVYVAALGESASGKEYPRTAIRRAFGAANLGPLVAVEDVTSDAAIHGVLEVQPAHLMVIDELGYFLTEAREKRSGIIKTLLRLYGVGVAPYYGKTYAVDRRTGRRDDYCVWAPCVSVYGTTVPGRFWESLTSADIDDGFLSRFLVFESDNPDPIEQNVLAEDQAPSTALVDAIERWHPSHDLAYNAVLAQGALPAIRSVPMAPEAATMLAAFTSEMRARRDAMRAGDDSRFVPLYKRARAHAIKLALIRAAGEQGPAVAEVTEADIQWGIELALWCTERVVQRAQAEIGESEHDKHCKQALGWIAAQGGAVKRNAFSRRFQAWGRRERDDVVGTLLESGQLREVRVRHGKQGGRPAAMLALASFVTDETPEPIDEIDLVRVRDD